MGMEQPQPHESLVDLQHIPNMYTHCIRDTGSPSHFHCLDGFVDREGFEESLDAIVIPVEGQIQIGEGGVLGYHRSKVLRDKAFPIASEVPYPIERKGVTRIPT